MVGNILSEISIIFLFSFLFYLVIATTYITYRLKYVKGMVHFYDVFFVTVFFHAFGALVCWVNRPNEATYFIYCITLASLISSFFFSIIFSFGFKNNYLGEATHYRCKKKYETCKLLFIMLVNFSIIFLILYNPGIRNLILSSILFPENIPYIVVRKAIASGSEGYLYPGLIRLLRDTMSPIILISCILSGAQTGNRINYFAALFILIISMMIGGQRFPIVQLIIAVLIATSSYQTINGRDIKIKKHILVVYLLIILFFFYLISFLLGRVGSEQNDASAIFWSMQSLFDRIFTTVIYEAAKTYDTWHNMGPTWGESWMSDLLILVPGHSKNSLSSLLHAAGGGSLEGNAPLFFSADSWLAFGWFGVLFSPLLFITVFYILESLFLSRRNTLTDSCRIVFLLNIPLMYSPYLFFFQGGLVVMPVCLFVVISLLLNQQVKIKCLE